MSGRLYRNLRDGFQGPVYAINPRTPLIDGARSFASVLEIPEPVDLAFIAVPAAHVSDVVRQCLEMKVRGLVVISAGYSETGAAGRGRERELLDLVRRAGIPMLGPNCFGVINTNPAIALRGVISPVEPPRGNVAFGSQSGALGVVIPDFARHWRLGLSSFVSIGNKADVGENDLLLHWEHDPDTRLIALYLESFEDPRGFLEHARRISRTKPILVLKAGRTGAGRRAASSHTAALASQDVATDAVFRQAGVIRAETLEELFDIAKLLATQPVPSGRRVGLLGNAGGPGVLCADALEREGLVLPEFSPGLQQSLSASLPPEACLHNPIDLIGTIDPQLYRRSLGLLLGTDEVDSVITIYVPRESGTMQSVVDAVRESATGSAAPKPILGVFMQSELSSAGRAAPGEALPCYLFPEAAARALARATVYGQWLQRPPGNYRCFGEIDIQAARRLIIPAVEAAGAAGRWLEPDTVQHLLTSFGVSVPRWAVVHSPDDAVARAYEWRAPVVAKVIAPSALHKSDSGGVVVNIRGEADIRQAYARVVKSAPDARGVLVQEYVPDSHEVLVGVNRDPAFGPLIGCGLGETLVELAGDVGFRLHPLTDRDAGELVDSGRLGWVLRGYRGRPPADRAALTEMLLRVSALVDAVPEIVEVDLNSVLVLPDSRGVRVVDARIRVAPAGGAPGLGQMAEEPGSRVGSAGAVKSSGS
jgi:acyl-CoA synthetase (NDP forming)